MCMEILRKTIQNCTSDITVNQGLSVWSIIQNLKTILTESDFALSDKLPGMLDIAITNIGYLKDRGFILADDVDAAKALAKIMVIRGLLNNLQGLTATSETTTRTLSGMRWRLSRI